jgi:hypothetical protein
MKRELTEVNQSLYLRQTEQLWRTRECEGQVSGRYWIYTQHMKTQQRIFSDSVTILKSTTVYKSGIHCQFLIICAHTHTHTHTHTHIHTYIPVV